MFVVLVVDVMGVLVVDGLGVALSGDALGCSLLGGAGVLASVHAAGIGRRRLDTRELPLRLDSHRVRGATPHPRLPGQLMWWSVVTCWRATSRCRRSLLTLVVLVAGDRGVGRR